eukprot:CAMPEP_0181234464 /NCGR_PEP_ID=MMETSP1096-20121128/36983_1 /TAXON_ID=156174 ORGANISM="Chrysochromulina ericina, Strain CCMP281" /NCGR_SAMPLE_ID=MMETSP1096 /ASSEMBLY_ACC=CAM_ASM_000453 /LENGTH=45 /DNA_ID= /DNA_START= /DNA_END= /DNA_ORIENTATION=
MATWPGPRRPLAPAGCSTSRHHRHTPVGFLSRLGERRPRGRQMGR